MSTYSEVLSYLESFIDYEKKPPLRYDSKTYSLSRTERLLNYLGNPHTSIRAIHITGTNGKGSTGAMLASILMSANFKVGFYSSPHLVSFRERIRIGTELIPEEKVCSLTNDIKSAVEKLEKDFSDKPSFFEVYTALAFLYFAEEKVDFAVLEVGMGGRLDATNVVLPILSIFTSIDIDHTRELGETRTAIAREKSEIIKEGVPVITCSQAEEVLQVIKEKCQERNSPLTEVRIYTTRCLSLRGIESRSNLNAEHLRENPLCNVVLVEKKFISQDGSKFRVYGRLQDYDDLSIPLLGEHQILNAGIAVAASELLKINPCHIRDGLRKTSWPGRIQLLHGKPPVLLDGAHNPAAARSLAVTIKTLFSNRKIILVLGVSSDKDIRGVGKELIPIASKVILTKANNPRAAEPAVLRKELIHLFKFSAPSVRTCSGRPARQMAVGACSTKAKQALPLQSTPYITNSSADALKIALNESSEKSIICVSGSFFLVGEMLELIRHDHFVFT